MTEKRRLTPDEWAKVRRRWEGSPMEGFDWLAKEISAAWGVDISRQAVADQAKRKGWEKGGDASEPLALLAQERPRREQDRKTNLAQEKPGKLRLVAGKGAGDSAGAESSGRQQGAGATKTPPPNIEPDDDSGDAPGKESKSARRRRITEPRRMEDKPGRVLSQHFADARKLGRPPEYIEAMCHAVHRLCLLGATDLEMAQFLDIDEATFYRWKDKYPDFCEAMKAGKAEADSRVTAGLYMRATGYVATVEKPMSVPVGGGASVIEIVQYNEYVAPDPKAAAYWLNNRRPADWKNNVVFTPAPPNAIADTKLLDAIYQRKQLQARELQARVTGRMERLGLVEAMSQIGVEDIESTDVEPENEGADG